MKYAIYLPNFGPFGDARVLAGLARDAESAGWDGFFLWDHVAGAALPYVDPWVALAAAAMSTERIRIGTTVTPLPRRRPWKVAREAVSIDHLSGGRFTLGVGIGLGEAEWGDLGEETDAQKRGAMLDEALEILAGLWSGEPFCYEGRYYHIQQARFLPRPVQQPRIPVWVGGFWPNKAPFRRAARWDGAFPLFRVETDEQELEQLREAAGFFSETRAAGLPPLDIISVGITPGDDPREAARSVRQRAELGATWWLESIAWYRYGIGVEDNWPVEKLRERVLQGPPVLD